MDLEFVQLGDTGLQTSEIQFGTWRFGKETEDGNVEIGEERAHELLDAYADHGGRFIDTADVYGGGKSLLPERSERVLLERHETITFCMIWGSVSAAAAA